MRIPFLNHNSVIANVSLAKQKVHPVTLELRQEYGDHHHFDMTLDYDMYGDDFLSNPVKHIELIGRLVFIRFKHQESSTEGYQFKGVVTSVRQTGREGKKGYLVVSGSSPTIMLEKGNRLDIYSNQSLYQITKQITERAYSDYISFGSEPVYKNKIEFLMQYNESDWDFLKRIAYLYRENLYYSGHELLFGSFDDLETVALTYDREIIDLEFCSKLLATNFERYQYVSQNDTTIERELPKQIDNSNDFVDSAEEMSYNAMNVQEHSKTYMDAPVYTNSEVSDLLKREKSRNAAQTITIKGKSKTYKTTLGRVIHISIPQELSATSTIGNYRVIKSIHRIDENNRYSCEFEAVPASLDTIPANQPKAQYADSVVARVKSNEDPLNQGRVQVDLKFASNYNYSWLRVLTPNAGSSTQVSQNRGMVFVPEKGDQVMIGFEYGDPNRPYVMGSLFHGKNGKGGGQNNAEKSIITKSGVQIVFNDDQRSLHIQDPSGNTWDMDGQGNITVTAPHQITFNSENILFNASKDITSNAGNSVGIRAANLISTNSEVMSQFVNGQWALQANTSLLNSLNRLNIESSYMVLASTQNMFVHSGDKILVNSLNRLDMRATNSIQSSQDSHQHEFSQQIDACVVDFRPSADFDAQYGFDWFRMGDLGEAPFENICAGANVIDKTTGKLTTIYRDDALEALLVNEYKDYFTVSGTDEIYLTPILNFYTQGALADFADLPKNERPVNVAKLTIFVSINRPIEKIQFTYDKSKFELSMDTLADNQPCEQQVSISGDLTITCKDPSKGFSQMQYITAHAVFTDNTPPQLVGKLAISPNAPQFRKKQKVLVLSVRTDINDSYKIIDFTSCGQNELVYLNKYLYQCFTELNLDVESIPFDLRDDENFKIRSNPNNLDSKTYGKFIFNEKRDTRPDNLAEDDVKDGNIYHDREENGVKTMYSYLRNQFFQKKENQEKYHDHIIIYLFNEDSYIKIKKENEKEELTVGQTEDYYSKNIVVFKERNKETMAHELLHAMGLTHTFETACMPNNKYFFPEGYTDNIMDYNNNGKYTYRWQWKIINDKFR